MAAWTISPRATPHSGWQMSGHHGCATAALSSTTPADTTAGTTAGRQHGKRAPPAAPDLGGTQTPQPPTPGQPGHEPFNPPQTDPQQTDPQQTDASAARLVAMMEKQTTALLNGLTGMLQQLLERQAQPLGAPADLHTPSPRQSPPGTAPTAPQATALPPPPAAALTLPPPPPTSSWGPPDPHRAPARHRRGETPQGRNSTGGKQHTGKPTCQQTVNLAYGRANATSVPTTRRPPAPLSSSSTTSATTSTAPCASRTRPRARSPLRRPSASLPLASRRRRLPQRWTS